MRSNISLGLVGIFLPKARWIFGGHFNIVEWVGDHKGGNDFLVASPNNTTWNSCKAIIQIFERNCQNKTLDYGGWFTHCNMTHKTQQ
jgi:hypothetical protein